MSKLKLLLIMCVFSVPLAGCESNDGPAEEMGERIDDAAENAGDGLEDAADDMEEGIEETCEKLNKEDC